MKLLTLRFRGYPRNGRGKRVTLARVATLLALAVVLPISLAAPLDPALARGKKVLYVYNKVKLEKTLRDTPTDTARVTMMRTQRSNDEKAMAYLQSLGFVVGGTDEYSPVELGKGIDLIVVSESVDALDVGGKYRDTPIPVLVFENDILPFMGMVGLKTDVDTGTKEKERLIYIVNAPHPLAGGLAAGTQNVLDDEHVRMNWGKPAPGAITVALVRGEPDKAAIFAYEKGATMNWEFLAPARRISFFLYSDTFEHLRPEGLALFRAAVLWAVAKPD